MDRKEIKKLIAYGCFPEKEYTMNLHNGDVKNIRVEANRAKAFGFDFRLRKVGRCNGDICKYIITQSSKDFNIEEYLEGKKRGRKKDETKSNSE